MNFPVPYTVAVDRSSTLIFDAAGASYKEHFRFVPHYELVDCKRYICFVPLTTTYALMPDVMLPIAPHGHVFNLIHGHIIKAAAEGRCLLVMDTSSEGDPAIPQSYAHLHDWLAKKGIPQTSVLIVNQSRVLGDQYRRLIGGEVRFSVFDIYLKRVLLIFESSDESFKNAVGFERDRVKFRPDNDAKRTFLSLNGAPRANRIVIMAGLSKLGMLNDICWSMLGDLSGKLAPNLHGALMFRNGLGLTWIEDSDLKSIVTQMPKIISEDLKQIKTLVRDSNELALVINPDLFDIAFCSIVTETEFTSGQVRRLTEKTLKPFSMGHPVIAFGNPGTLKLMRSIGFATFSDIINESYDDIEDAGTRFMAVVEALREFRAFRASRDHGKVQRLEEICLHNIQVARSGTAVAIYEKSVEISLLNAILEALSGLSPAALK